MPSEKENGLLDRIDCPRDGCDWHTEFDGGVAPNRMMAEVNAGVHWMQDHGGQIPDDAPFGEYQCPQCDSLRGLLETASCKDCGFVPEEVRA